MLFQFIFLNFCTKGVNDLDETDASHLACYCWRWKDERPCMRNCDFYCPSVLRMK